MALNISNLFGQSLSALSLSSPTTASGLVAAGGALTVLASAAIATAIHKEWVHYKESKYKVKIDEVNRFYKKRLERIESPDGTFLNGFPPIFKYAKDNKTVDSLHYTIDEIDELATEPPHIEAVLASYREDILDAIRGLKEYYKSRDPKKYNDVTSGVISYLLNMLQNKCLSFEGYNNDIAYLDALTLFIDDYASQKGRKTQHFSRLGPIYTSLVNAKQKLERHQKSMPLKALVDELRETAIKNSDRMLRILIKMVVSAENAYLGDLVTYHYLLEGILRGQYIRSESGGRVVWSWDKEIKLPDCVFRDWIVGLAKYYKQSLIPNSVLQENNIIHPNDLYTFAQWAQSELKTNQIRIELESELDAVRTVFRRSPNFINTKLIGIENNAEFIPVTEDYDVIERIICMADFAHLVHGVISLQAFCAHLIGSIEQLGSIYIEDPHHFNKIFAELEVLCNQIESDIKKNRKNFLNIAINNKNTMRLAKEGVFPDNVDKVIKAVNHMLEHLGQLVIYYKSQHPASSPRSIKVAANDMLSVARFFTKMYSPGRFESIEEKEDTSSNQDSVPTLKDSYSGSASKLVGPIDDPINLILNKESTLNRLSVQINSRISAINKESSFDQRLEKYQTIYTSLRALQSKSIDLLSEKTLSAARTDKATKTYNLVLSLFQTTLQFLSLAQEERKEQAPEFIKKIHAELSTHENRAFIDKHRDSIPKFIYEHWGFFHTATRNRLSTLEQACNELHV